VASRGASIRARRIGQILAVSLARADTTNESRGAAIVRSPARTEGECRERETTAAPVSESRRSLCCSTKIFVGRRFSHVNRRRIRPPSAAEAPFLRLRHRLRGTVDPPADSVCFSDQVGRKMRPGHSGPVRWPASKSLREAARKKYLYFKKIPSHLTEGA
jgi:hypothetical protein